MGIPTFVLASASAARRRLLQTVGIEPIVCPSDFDESQVKISDPAQLVEILSQRKAETVAPRFESALVMGCDSVLAINGEIHGKPTDAEEARQRWRVMQGSFGDLYTGHTLIDNLHQNILVKHQVTRVTLPNSAIALLTPTLPRVNPSSVLVPLPWKGVVVYLWKKSKVVTVM